MAAIVFSTALKTSALARIASPTGNKFMDPNEFGAKVRRVEVNHVASGAVGTTDPIILAEFDRDVTIVGMSLVVDSAVTTVNIGTTPVSLPVDTVNNIAAASTGFATANSVVTPAGAINLRLTDPSYVIWKPASGSLADTKILKGSIFYVDNT